MDNPNAERELSPRSDLVLSSTLCLLSQCALGGLCPGRAAMVLQHLNLVAQSESQPPMLRSTCRQLLDAWHVAQGHLLQAQDTDGADEGGLPASRRPH